MDSQTSLRKWAIENKVWEPKTWEKFLKEDIVPFYKDAYTIWKIYKFLYDRFGKNGKYRDMTLGDIKDIDEVLYDKLVTAIYGGIGENKDPNKSFAKFMYDVFGLQVADANTFEDSIKMYEEYGDCVRIVLNEERWVEKWYISYIVDTLYEIINQLCCEKIKMSPMNIGLVMDKNYKLNVSDLPDPSTLLPGVEESPDKLMNLFNRFLQKALDLLVGKNPFITFAFYVREIPLSVLAEFLNLNLDDSKDMDKIIKLVNLLDLEVYSIVDMKYMRYTEYSQLSTKSAENMILTRKNYDGCYYSHSLIEEIMLLHNLLMDVDERVKKEYEKTIEKYIQQIHVEFKPWKEYEPFFKALKIAFREWEKYEERIRKEYEKTIHVKFNPWKEYLPSKALKRVFREWEKYEELRVNEYIIKLCIEKRKITSIKWEECMFYKYLVPRTKIPLKQLLLGIAPAISSGLIEISIYNDTITMKFHPFAEKWIDKVIKGAGKT